jgi:hypothetical protein
MKKFILCSVLLMVSTHLWAIDSSDHLSDNHFANITKSCKIADYIYEKGYFIAKCRAKDGRVYNTSLRLRMVNRSGRLTEDTSQGDWPDSCRFPAIDSAGVIATRCPDNFGRYKWSTVNITKSVFNYNGSLVYKDAVDRFLDISKTCENFGNRGTSLYANCKASNGWPHTSWILLRGLNVYNGVLTIEKDSNKPSTLSDHCRRLEVDSKGELSGECRDDSGNYIKSSVQLAKLIFNYNGSLVYPLKD